MKNRSLRKRIKELERQVAVQADLIDGIQDEIGMMLDVFKEINKTQRCLVDIITQPFSMN